MKPFAGNAIRAPSRPGGKWCASAWEQMANIEKMKYAVFSFRRMVPLFLSSRPITFSREQEERKSKQMNLQASARPFHRWLSSHAMSGVVSQWYYVKDGLSWSSQT
jgi:hypothetical protein